MKEKIQAIFHAKESEAKAILEDKDKWNSFKEKLEGFLKKTEKVPFLGGVVDDIVTMIFLVDSYVKREYRAIPKGTVIAIVAALIYVFSPINLIPDFIPIIGFLDDAFVVRFILEFGVDKDLDRYRKWRKENHSSDSSSP